MMVKQTAVQLLEKLMCIIKMHISGLPEGSVKNLTLGVSLGGDFRVVRSGPPVGCMLSGEPA